MEKILIKDRQSFRFSLKKKIKASRFLILMILPAIAFYFIFCYIPMYGVLIAFTDYWPEEGISGSIINHWVGFQNFVTIFNDLPDFWDAFKNTLIIGSLKIVISFVAAVTVALIINELRMKVFKKTAQIIVTFPHFLSWVVVASLFRLLLGGEGAITHLVSSLGGTPLPIFSDGKTFLGFIFASDIWKEAGWSSIIYIATMAGISTDLYEAADIDGASRLQKIWHITLPGIRSTAILLLIMSVGGVLSAGFDQIYNMTSQLGNSIVLKTTQIIDTYIYDYTFGFNRSLFYGESSAIGLFKSVIGFVLVIVTDRIAKLCGERGII